MKQQRIATGLLAGLLCLPAFAHHSRAMFDTTISHKVEGTVVAWQFANPHSILVVRVKNADGSTTDLELESDGNTSAMTRTGWRSSSLRAGELVSVTYSPMRSAVPGGMFLNASVLVFPDGGPKEGVKPPAR